MAIQAEEFAGRVILIWPKPTGGCIPGSRMTLADADTGQPIVSALDVTVQVRLDEAIVAEMTMLVGEDGKPLPAGEPVRFIDGTDEVPTGKFRWLVSEIRNAE